MSTWGEFQSVIQLSAAVNLVVFTLASIGLPALDSEIRQLESLDYEINKLKEKDKVSESKMFDNGRLDLLRRADTLRKCEPKIFEIINLTSLLFFIIGLILLIVSSYRYHGEISKICICLSIILNFPAIVSTIKVSITMTKTNKIRQERRKLEAEIDKLF